MKIKVKFLPLIFMLVLQVTSCAHKIQKNNLQISPPTDPVISEKPMYRLGFGDTMEIRFFNNRQYNITVPVRPDGRITLEKIGDILVDGQTPVYVDSVITAEFSKFLKDPEVTVIVTEFGNNHFYVLGEVDTPGRFEIAKNMTAFQAIAMAGGTTKDAKLSHVLLIRNAASPNPSVRVLDLKNVQNDSNNFAYRLALKTNDIVYIPNTRISDFAGFMTNIYSTILPPIDSYLRAIFWSRL